MDNSFLSYLQRLELMAFFSGYPLIYTITLYVGSIPGLKNIINSRIAPLLPFTYAIAGTLFMGLQLKKLYPDYSAGHVKQVIQLPYLTIWGLLSILFWIPALSKRKSLSLMHSLVFFFLPVSDLFLQLFSSGADKDVVKNDMNVYAGSLILNVGSLAILALLSSLFAYYRQRLKASRPYDK